MLDLVVLVCSVLASGSCTEKHILIDFDGSPMACAMQAPPLLAQWVNEHPNQRIARWKCALPQLEMREG